MKKLVLLRRLSQGFFLALFIFILWSTTYPLTGAVPSGVFFAVDPLVMLVTSLSERLVLRGVAPAVLMLVVTLVLGRFFCGWVCPLGTMIDAAGFRAGKKEFTPEQNKKARRVKFYLLGFIFICALLGLQIAWIFDPIVLAARFVSLNLIPTLTFLTDGFFSRVIRLFGLYGPVYDFYRGLKGSFLGVNVYYFSHSLIILSLFAAILFFASRLRRSWCRVVCPLGALYALAARYGFLKRTVTRCTGCGRCSADCRMGAITKDNEYVQGECILCMDCIYDCPAHGTRFSFAKPAARAEKQAGVTRRDFLLLALAALLPEKVFAVGPRGTGPGRPAVIRPPASLEEEEFLNRCIRCGNCMKVCITNGLQPALFESGAAGIWTPRLVPEIGYCEYHCTLCGNVCPTGAIPRLTENEKSRIKLGTALIDRSLCLPWARNTECLVCEEHCPVSPKAIRLQRVIVKGKTISRPQVVPELCVGCGICQNKCPVRPGRAISVSPEGATRPDTKGRSF
jgi:polyferredoxin